MTMGDLHILSHGHLMLTSEKWTFSRLSSSRRRIGGPLGHICNPWLRHAAQAKRLAELEGYLRSNMMRGGALTSIASFSFACGVLTPLGKVCKGEEPLAMTSAEVQTRVDCFAWKDEGVLCGLMKFLASELQVDLLFQASIGETVFALQVGTGELQVQSHGKSWPPRLNYHQCMGKLSWYFLDGCGFTLLGARKYISGLRCALCRSFLNGISFPAGR